MIIIQCDKCSTQSKPQDNAFSFPDDWKEIEYRITRYGGQKRTYHLCPSCVKALNIPCAKDAELGDQFLDILSELAADAVENAIANQ